MNDVELLHVAAQAKKGDTKAQALIVKQFTPFLRSMAGKFSEKSNIPIDELIQEGSIGLLKALYAFNPKMGAKLSTFVIYSIKKSMMMAVRTNTNATKRMVSVDDAPDVESLDPNPIEVCIRAENAQLVQSALKKLSLDASRKAILTQRLMTDCPEALDRLGKRFGVTGECLRKRELELKRLLRSHLKS